MTASRRTDVPAFYTPWLLGRIEAGYCHTINPVSGLVHRVSLDPAAAPVLGMYTRDPRPLLPHIGGLRERGFAIFAHVTVNGYGEPLEPRSPKLACAISAVRELAEELEPGATVWRYDPVVLAGEYDEEYHVARFAEIAAGVGGAVEECYISFVDPYAKTLRNLREAAPDLAEPSWEVGERHRRLASRFAEIAASQRIVGRSCAEPSLGPVVRTGACVDAQLVARLAPGAGRLSAGRTREYCGCAAAIDIGTYGTCAFGCAYCYATESPALGLTRLREHDPEDSVIWRPEHLRDADLDELASRVAGGRASSADADAGGGGQQALFGE